MSVAETIAFQAETKELLQLVIHSLYKHREIFLRELVSNASDALDKLRYAALTAPELYEGDERLAIRIELDPNARTLRVIDNGIGMTRDEVIENIGTIARSGTRGFAEALKAARKADVPELIGQFGVGFYSAFMVAEEVTLETRHAGAPPTSGVRWSSRGDGDYTLEDVELAQRGTAITLKLRAPDEDEQHAQDFTHAWVVRDVVKRYSDFVGYPIELAAPREDEKNKSAPAEPKVDVINSQRPLWTRPKEEITAEEYAEFYRHVSHDWREPLRTIHTKAEGKTEFTALLYIPKDRPYDLFDPTRHGSRLNLYVRRVFIMADCEELLPPWLRFVRGTVDAADLPLNVSRETLQENRQVRQIQKHLVRKTLDALRAMLADARDDYVTFWRSFGRLIKEGIYIDQEHRAELAKLVLAETSRGEELTTFDEYVQRMPEGQDEIYVLPAESRAAALRSPHLEGVRARGFEVLLLVDPIDEFVLQRLTELDGRKIRAVDKGGLELKEDDETRSAREQKSKELKPLLELVRKELADDVEEVRFSSRLTESPAVLVSADSALSPQIEAMLRETGQDVPERKRVLELNPKHPLIEKLRDLAADDATYARFADFCVLLHGQALLAEGNKPKDTARFSRLVAELMV